MNRNLIKFTISCLINRISAEYFANYRKQNFHHSTSTIWKESKPNLSIITFNSKSVACLIQVTFCRSNYKSSEVKIKIIIIRNISRCHHHFPSSLSKPLGFPRPHCNYHIAQSLVGKFNMKTNKNRNLLL